MEAYQQKCEELGIKPNSHMLQHLQRMNLLTLDLELLYLGLKGISAVISVLKAIPTLQEISLRNSQLSNEIVVELAAVCQSHPNIWHIDVSHNPVTLPAAKALLTCSQENPNITQVDLDNTEISEQYRHCILLQSEQNRDKKNPHKDNSLTDEETRGKKESLEDWEWDSNCGDQLLLQDQEAADVEADEEALNGGAFPYPPDEDEPQPKPVDPNPPPIKEEELLGHRPVCPSMAVADIVQELFRSEGKWTDPDFKPSVNAVWSKRSAVRKLHKGRGLVWKRVSEICKADPPALFGPEGTPAAPCQGALANAWFISAAAVIYRQPEFLQKLFTTSHPEIGVYELQFYKCGQWLRVTIDDWIPCNADGQPLFATCFDPTQPWPLLLEKAYAKLHGGYDRLELGSSTQALEDLTGGVAHNLTLRTLQKAKELVGSGELLEQLQRALFAGAVLAASYRAPDAMLQTAAAVGSGISPNVLYSLLKVQRLDDWTLVQLHNPWGKVQWPGKFGPGTADWTPERREALQYSDAEEAAGLMWMTFEDFATFFNRAYVLELYADCLLSRLSPKPWFTVRHVGEWVGRTAGGRFREQNWTENPAYSLLVREKTAVVKISLAQTDTRVRYHPDSVDYPIAIGFYVIKTEDARQKKKHYTGSKDTVYSATFVASRSVNATVTLYREQQYLIVPCTRDPGQEARYCLTVTADSPITSQPVADNEVQNRVSGAWRRDSAGGRITGHETWVNNPQFHLQMKQAAKASITLFQEPNPSGSLFHIAFYVFKGHELVAAYDPKKVAGFSDFLPFRTVFRDLQLEAGSYVIMPMTWNKAENTAFSLTVYTTAAVQLTKFQRLVDQAA